MVQYGALLLTVAASFTGNVKLKAIGVLGGPDPAQSPSEMRW